MSSTRFRILVAAVLLPIFAGCEMTIGPDPVERSAEDACMEQGFELGTAEHDNCVEELSEPDQ